MFVDLSRYLEELTMKRTQMVALALLIGFGMEVGSAKAAPFVLVANGVHGTVSVIDAASNTVATTIPISSSSLRNIAVAPNGSFAYVGGPGTVWVIDTAEGVVTDTIPVGSGFAFAFTRDSALAYVVNGNSVWVIDTASRTVVGDPIPLPTSYGNATAIAIAPDDTQLYVLKHNGGGNGTISFIDTSAKVVIDTIEVGPYSSDVAVSSDGTRVYVVNALPGTLSVINTSTRTVIDTISTGPAQFLRITRDGQLAYLSGVGNAVSVIALNTRQIVGSIPVPYAFGLVLSADERFLYVSRNGCGVEDRFCGGVWVVDAATRTVVATIRTGKNSDHLALAPTLVLVPPPDCADGADDDGDEAIDWGPVAPYSGSPPVPGYGDPGCESPFDESERVAALICDDGIDNDGDGLTDYPTDPGCFSQSASIEDPACDNGVDDDGDELADFPADPACFAPYAEIENRWDLACDDGLDNDSDGFADHADTDCGSLTTGIEHTDVDSDGVSPRDNCTLVPNPSQLDSDLDGYGNLCDGDFDEDGIVAATDIFHFKQAYHSVAGDLRYRADVDLDGDGAVSSSDFSRFRSMYLRSPGPSGYTCAGFFRSCECEYFFCGGGGGG